MKKCGAVKENRLLDEFPVGAAVYRLEDTAKALFCSDEAIRLYGYTREEYEQSLQNDNLKIVYVEDRPMLVEEIKNALKESRDAVCTYRIYHKSGAIRWHQLTAVPAGDENGYPLLHAAFLDVTQNRKELEEFRFKAEHDALTGIYNKQRFFTEARKLLKENPKQQYILLRADVYRFKIINDIFGRETGDRLLKALARQLVELSPPEVLYARFEGDDFVALVPKEKLDVNAFEESGRKLKVGLGLNLNIVLYIGLYEIEDRDEPIELMCDRAQMALREIKGDYVKRYVYYSDSLRKTFISEQEILADMEQVLARKQLIVYYQPVYDAVTGELRSAEALVRWQHPRKGLLMPGDFIPYFEQTGFIRTMDYYVWEEVCSFLKERILQGKKVVPVSVNVSRINLYNMDFQKEIEALVERYGLDPGYIRLEITETAYMDDQEQFIRIIKKLQEHGFTVLMDDFGTGYSSLTMLKNVPVDVLKLDRQFISDIGSSEKADQIIEGIIQIAGVLGMDLIAEGVETKDQCEFIRQAGCGAVQGYYFSRPVSQESFESLLEEM